jgi:soluble lytic murein transglycosylase
VRSLFLSPGSETSSCAIHRNLYDSNVRSSRKNLGRVLIFLLVCSSVAVARTNSLKPAPKKTAAHRSAQAKPAPAKPATAASAGMSAKELESLSRDLKGKTPAAAYARLSTFASTKSFGVAGARAALALGYYDYSRQHLVDAAKWLNLARRDTLLADYAIYWQAENDLAQQRNAEALAELQEMRKSYPNSVMTEQALQALGEAAVAAKQPQAAVDALDNYTLTPERPALLFLRGEAHEQAQQPVQAAADYQAIYTHYPLSDQAKEAGIKLDYLHSTLGDQVAQLSMGARMTHAQTIFLNKQWSDARTEYAQILPQLTGADRDRAEVRIMECGISLGAGIAELSALQVTDPEADAERHYTIADYYRAAQAGAQMNQEVLAAVSRAPSSQWADNALFLAGNYYWVQLDRDQAATFYRQDEEQFPTSVHAAPAQWRVAWTAVLKREPNSADLLTEHLRRFPGSAFTADALYWLGRLAEEANNNDLARTYYTKLGDRYPGSFFDMAAAQRAPRTDPGPTPNVDVLAMVPPIPPAAALGSTVPAAAADRQARADALRSIAFDASAELELRAGYALTGEPLLLVEAAKADVAAQQWGAAIVTLRQVYPQLEYRHFDTVPREVWLAAYAFPHEQSIRTWAAHNGLDPMLVAGLSRQESAFNPNAHSNMNALGVMQILPKTGRLLANQQKIRYSTSQLFNADYNIRLGTAYFSDLKKQFGSDEAALAAYNAGEDRLVDWTEQPYRDIPEFVDSIPFTETRDYVEIITRNAGIYRRLYATPQAASKPAAAKPASKAKAAPKHKAPAAGVR